MFGLRGITLRRRRDASFGCSTNGHQEPVHLGECGSVAWLYCRSCGAVWTRHTVSECITMDTERALETLRASTGEQHEWTR